MLVFLQPKQQQFCFLIFLCTLRSPYETSPLARDGLQLEIHHLMDFFPFLYKNLTFLQEDEPLSATDKERGLLKANISLQKYNTDEGSDYSSLQQVNVEAELRHSPQTNNVSELKRNNGIKPQYSNVLEIYCVSCHPYSLSLCYIKRLTFQLDD